MRLHQMFRQVYPGGSVHKFIDALKIYGVIYDRKRRFGRSISILQSSGTGKSRLVEEIGHEVLFDFILSDRSRGINVPQVPTLSICFQESGSSRYGWPLGDEPAC
jgi:hypothetical protein